MFQTVTIALSEARRVIVPLSVRLMREVWEIFPSIGDVASGTPSRLLALGEIVMVIAAGAVGVSAPAWLCEVCGVCSPRETIAPGYLTWVDAMKLINGLEDAWAARDSHAAISQDCRFDCHCASGGCEAHCAACCGESLEEIHRQAVVNEAALKAA